MKAQKVTFEQVSAIDHPEYYQGDHPRVPAEMVPDEHWHRTERIGDDVRGQYNGLRRLIEQGELIRNVRLYEANVSTEIEWRDVTPGGAT